MKQLPDVIYGYGNNQTYCQKNNEDKVRVVKTIDEIRPVIKENKCMEQKDIKQMTPHKSQRPLYQRIRLRDFKNE
jgi:ribosomal protein L19E